MRKGATGENETISVNMETKENKKQDSADFLKEKKARDGRLSKIGEWLLSGKGKELGWTIAPENMKYILK